MDWYCRAIVALGSAGFILSAAAWLLSAQSRRANQAARRKFEEHLKSIERGL